MIRRIFILFFKLILVRINASMVGCPYNFLSNQIVSAEKGSDLIKSRELRVAKFSLELEMLGNLRL